MKKTKANQSVYRNQNSLIRTLFERAGDARKVLCVALDYAKRKHLALICDGNGDVLKSSFPVENNTAGIEHLLKEISATARHRKIPQNQIFLGGEDEAAYVANFTQALRLKGYLVVRVNAYEAKENRENLLASTDGLDLLGIAKTLLSRRARVTGEPADVNPAYRHLRDLTRCRRTLVRQQTAASNRIHALAEELFPGFLNGSKSALTPFTEASLELRAEAALLLATTPYVMLTSIPGIGFVLAAGLAGELGEPSCLSKLDSLCAYAGIVPRTFQSGGPDSPAIQGHASPRCNRILKDWTVQSAQKIHLYGPSELKDRITRWNAEGRHGLFAAARHNLRLVSTLVKNEIPYLAPAGRGRHATPAQIEAAAHATWLILLKKWRTISGGQDLIVAESHPMGCWRKLMLELHGIDLPARP